jgi:hypothetical protein
MNRRGILRLVAVGLIGFCVASTALPTASGSTLTFASHEPHLPSPHHRLRFTGSAHAPGGAAARMMMARHTCFCGALRSEMIASS